MEFGYKAGQGYWTRLMSAIGGCVLALSTGAWVAAEMTSLTIMTHDRLGFEPMLLRAGVGIAITVLLSTIVIWLCYYKKNTVDFMIATETEMKKVNWSTRSEVLGSARVVIFISFLLAAILFGVDIVFKVIFEQIGLLHS